MGLLDGLLGQVLGGGKPDGQRGSPELGDLIGQVLGGARDGNQGAMPDLGDMLGRLGGGTDAAGRGGTGGMGGIGGLGGAGIGALIAIALQMLQRQGGLEAVLGRLQQTGHASEAESWLGGGHAPLAPDALSDVFGRDEIGQAARQMGVSEDEAAGGLAAIFPEIVNRMTPHGRVESGSDDVVARALEQLQSARPR